MNSETEPETETETEEGDGCEDADQNGTDRPADDCDLGAVQVSPVDIGEDAGPMGTDAGPMGTDAGPMGTDAGGMGTDAGTMMPMDDGGCGCRVHSDPTELPPAAMMLFGLVGVVLVRRRR